MKLSILKSSFIILFLSWSCLDLYAYSNTFALDESKDDIRTPAIVVSDVSNTNLNDKIPDLNFKSDYKFFVNDPIMIGSENSGDEITKCLSLYNLPIGLSLSKDCSITGTSNETGKFVAIVIAFNKHGSHSSAPFVINITPKE